MKDECSCYFFWLLQIKVCGWEVCSHGFPWKAVPLGAAPQARLLAWKRRHSFWFSVIITPLQPQPCGPRENAPYTVSVLVAAPLCPSPSWLRNKVGIGSYKVTETHFLYLLISGDFCSFLLLEFFWMGLEFVGWVIQN